jgi:hypothetical protein
MSTTVMQMLRASPGAPFTDDRLLAECISTCAEAAQLSVGCADACLGQPQTDPLRRCIRLTMDCADVCEAAARILLRPHEPDLGILRRQLETAVIACQTCADECARHAQTYEHCRICLEACRRCAEVCGRVCEALDRLPEGVATRH